MSIFLSFVSKIYYVCRFIILIVNSLAESAFIHKIALKERHKKEYLS